MEDKLTVTISVEDLIALVRDQERLNAVVNYTAAEPYSVDKKVIYTLAGRPELIKEEQK